MDKIHIVISVWHGRKKDATFVHGAFDCFFDAQNVATKIQKEKQFITDEGYELKEEEAQSVYISSIPYNTYVNDYVPTIL